MYKVSKRAVLYLLLFSYLVFSVTSLQAQNKLKRLLDKAVRAKNKKIEVSEKTLLNQVAREQENDSMVASVKNDTGILLKDKQIIEPSVLFDTSKIQTGNQTVKTRQSSFIANNEVSWQRGLLLTHSNVYKKEHKLDGSITIFGWHPYWMGTAYYSYNFSLLSAVAYTSYEINPATGYYNSIHDWRTTKLIDSAHVHSCKVLLSATNIGYKNNMQFLSNLNAQHTFINTLITLLRERNADGVNIDFEDIPLSVKNNLTNFIIDLSSSIRAAKKDYMVTIALPAIDSNYVYDVKQMNKYVDLFIIMGYEFHGHNSAVAGPLAPLGSGKTWSPYNLERSVDEYIVSGIKPYKLLLGLPYFGAEWQTEDLKFPSRVEKFIRYPMYRNIKKMYGDLSGSIEEDSKSSFYVYRDENNHYRQIWFEDEKTLAKKYDWVITKKIGGIGIWALGYDNGYTELWKLLADKFATKPGLVLTKVSTPLTPKSKFSFKRIVLMAVKMITNPKVLLSRRGPMLGIFIGLFGFSLSGIYLLIRYGHKIKRFYKIVIQGGIALTILLFFALLFVVMKYTGIKEVLYLLSGFIVAGILFIIITRHFLMEKDLP